MKIYTRTGDGGDTGLFGGGRVSKDHLRVRAYGTVDELNSVLGWTLTQLRDSGIRERLSEIQHDLFAIGADLATPPPQEGRTRPGTPPMPSGRVATMESWIDATMEELEPLNDFILPGGSPGSAALHVARTVCRRAERTVVSLAHADEVHETVVPYLNRLSDVLFALARLENQRAGVDDVVWRKERVAADSGPEAPEEG